MAKIIKIIPICFGLICGLAESETNQPADSDISDRAYDLLTQRTAANRKHFYIYKDADSGFNHGFASGVFADSADTARKIQIDASCLDDISRAERKPGSVLTFLHYFPTYFFTARLTVI